MRRRRTTQLLPVVAAVLTLTLAACGSDEDADGAEPTAQAPADTTTEPESETPGATELTVDPAASTARCMVPNAEALATQTTAFEGTVTSLDGGTATLEVDRWFAGTESEQVTVAAPDADLRALLVAVEFEVGRTYLVSATGDQVSLCGFTAEKTPELEALYAEAFGS